MKTLFALIILTISTSSFATSYCYDYAMFATYETIEALEECSKDLNLQRFKQLNKRLTSYNPMYATRVTKAMRKIATFFYNDVYEIESVEIKSCIRKVGRKEFQKLKLEVMDALIECR